MDGEAMDLLGIFQASVSYRIRLQIRLDHRTQFATWGAGDVLDTRVLARP